MKKWSIICFLFFTAQVFAQDSEEEFRLFMLEHPSFVSFNDVDKLDPSVRYTKDLVSKFLASKGENIAEYYQGGMVIQTIYQGGELHKDEYLSFPIFHINTFKALLQFKKANPEKYWKFMKEFNPIKNMVGNASGKDARIEINHDMTIVKLTILE